jgi:thiol:disulfide interchange protein
MPKTVQSSQPKRHSWTRIAGVVAVALAIASVLLLKWQTQPTSSSSDDQGNVAEASDRATPAASVTWPHTGSPEAQLDSLLTEGHPVLAFFHSDTCYQCVQMTGIVGQVYPEYANSVALVDVNVYDERNGNLLRRAGIRVIPTLIFFDRQGRGQVAMGVMQPDQLRQQLQRISEER